METTETVLVSFTYLVHARQSAAIKLDRAERESDGLDQNCNESPFFHKRKYVR
jgi:hypothetical protein